MKCFRNVPATLLILLGLGCMNVGLYGQLKQSPSVEAKFGKGVRIKAADESFYFKFEARFQTLFQANIDLGSSNEAFDAEAMIRRARLKFSGYAFKPAFEYKVELGLSNRDIQVKGKDSDYANIILDAYMRMKLFKNLKLRIGQFKLPGNRERIISSGSLQFVDRSIINSRFNVDRDAGAMLENKTELGKVVLHQYLAISTGEGRNRLGADDGFSYSGRVEVLPLGEFSKKGDYIEGAIHREAKPKVSIGLSGSYNDDAQRTRGQLGDWMSETRDLKGLEADFIFKFKGLSALGEVATRSASNPIIGIADDPDAVFVYKGSGWNAQAAYMFKNNWEVAGRFSDLHPHRDIHQMTNRQSDFTLAVSKYWVGHKLKVQGDITYSNQTPYVTTRSGSERMIVRITTNLNF